MDILLVGIPISKVNFCVELEKFLKWNEVPILCFSYSYFASLSIEEVVKNTLSSWCSFTPLAEFLCSEAQ